MEIKEFLKNFTDQIEEADASTIIAGTNFRDIEGWSSLTALSIIAMVDEVYKVKLKGEDIRQSQTVEDLFKIVSSRVG